MDLNRDEIDWSTMHNRIIPKEKLISLEQFYNLTLIENNNNNNNIIPTKTETPDENNKSLEIHEIDRDEINLNVSNNNDQLSSSISKQSNLRVDHFKFINNSKAKLSSFRKKLNQHGLNNTPPNLNPKLSYSFSNRDDKKPVLQIQNHNLIFMTPKDQMTESKQQQQTSKIVKNKIFTIQTEFQNEDESKKQSNTKLTYLKRYVANFSKNGQTQFPDGYWGNNPNNENITKPKISNTPNNNTVNSSLSINQEKPTPTNMFGNYIPFNPNQASLNPSLKDRELSIIDLQLPIRNSNQSGSYVSKLKKFPNDLSDSHDEVSLTSNLSRMKNLKNSQSVLIESLDCSNVASRTNNESNEITNDFGHLTNAISEIDDLIKHKKIDRSNTFLSKYLTNQQKKKLNNSSSNGKLYEANFNLNKLPSFKSSQNLVNSNLSSVVLNKATSNTDIVVNSSLNNLSSNSLLIKRLKF
ncbi:unnamed protein product [Brachionus calyciflorus]|uniref:Uncharacterized protein n=1 Tax=Brachionus calyciflorus TaxID=104777 RepID=A0A814JD01_9BILA|nr:unnamed protein product [Brachionus calyciflorus]